jgi:hypothetical protein
VKPGNPILGLKPLVAPDGKPARVRPTIVSPVVDEPGVRATVIVNMFEPVVRTCILDGAVTLKS